MSHAHVAAYGVLVGCMLLPSATVTAQPPADSAAASRSVPGDWGLWLSVPIISTSNVGGTSGAVALSYQHRHLLVSARVSYAEGPPCDASDCWPDAVDAALLVGYAAHPWSNWHASIGTGIGVGESENRSSFGVPLEAQLSWRPTRFLGAGGYVWWNSVGPFSGVSFVIQAGRLR